MSRVFIYFYWYTVYVGLRNTGLDDVGYMWLCLQSNDSHLLQSNHTNHIWRAQPPHAKGQAVMATFRSLWDSLLGSASKWNMDHTGTPASDKSEWRTMNQHHQSLQYLSPTATTQCIILTTGDSNELLKPNRICKSN